MSVQRNSRGHWSEIIITVSLFLRTRIKMDSLLLFALVIPFFVFDVKAGSIDSNGRQLDGSYPEEDIKYHYEVKKFNVPVDHFSFTRNDTFKIRYLVNDTWQRGDNSPIFFYTGNEGNITVFAENTGFMWEIAPTFGALLIFAEHRYYGESVPFGNLSYSDADHLGYLTSQQALADYADLISYLKSAKNMTHSPVIIFGGSYGGMLSAWMRMKYPHIVNGAIAASAPILQFTGITSCDAFARVVTSDFEAASPLCRKSIRKSWNAIRNITSTKNGTMWLSENWKLCPSSDVKLLKDFLTDVYGNLAMVNYPYKTNFLAPLPANPISAFCSHLTNPNLDDKSLLLALKKALSVYTNSTGTTECLIISDDAAPALGAKGWPYQACTEMVMPMCSDGINDMFEPTPWNIDEYAKQCYKNFQIKPQPYLVCEMYGCKDLSTASNIVFSNGLLDPWSTGGVISNVSSSTIAILIPEAAHHLDLRASNPRDPYSVVQARKIHCAYIKKWIREEQARVIERNDNRYEIVNV
ncbi:lysosomal Pro-X carboxypeptidase [Athalia rosae]|uniref:lysosomal Pro-X carboxypeptidase n=1 Tax=Athalia rosae TaxID=37344 RepID=UPI0020344220|nr:lysosomal Pro-X carboxypeptidase [Athalia rosae]